MKRSELYAMVWDRPMTKVAAEIGISAVGLAKTCRRHDIPVPARGHWAKLDAGKLSPSIALPHREVETEVPVATSPRAGTKLSEGSIQAAVSKQLADAGGVETSIPMSPTLERPHLLVKATAAYVRRIPAVVAKYQRRPIMERFGSDIEQPPFQQHGLYHLSNPGSLRLVASMAQMDWVLRFHDALFKALVHAGAKIVLVPADRDKTERVAAEKSGERVFLTFRENYRREEIDPDELARLRRENDWAKSWRYVPSGKFTLAVAGTEYPMSAEWKATGEQLETKLPVIVETCLTLLRSQPASRAARLEREEASRKSAEAAARVRQRQAAQAKQLENAFEAAQTYRRVEELKSFLKIFEEQMPTFNKPYDERAKVWLEVVEAELERQNPYSVVLSKCLAPESWRGWPPDWWPEQTAVTASDP